MAMAPSTLASITEPRTVAVNGSATRPSSTARSSSSLLDSYSSRLRSAHTPTSSSVVSASRSLFFLSPSDIYCPAMKALALLLLIALPVFPQETHGVVWFFRLEEADKFNSGKPKVWIDDRLALLMPESEFVGVKLTPGRHVFRMQNKSTVTPLTVEAGRVYFIRVSEVPAHGYQRNLFIVSPEQAAEQMRDLKALQDKNIKDKDLKTVSRKPAPALSRWIESLPGGL